MNPYAAATFGNPKTPVKTNQEIFAAGVYRDDADPRRDAGAAVGDEIARLRAELRGETRALRSKMARPRAPAELLAEIAALRAAVDELFVAPKRADAITQLIRARGIEGACAAALARRAKRKSNVGSVEDRLRSAAASLVRTAPWPATLSGKTRGIIALVGPAGVGKTTTAAKLAARARMARKSVALVSCDSFRVGAVDQLAAYAELMDVRMHFATNQAELIEIVSNERAEVVIVDTSGRAIEADATEAALSSPEIVELAKSQRQLDVVLCVPASLRAADATRVARDFAIAQPTSFAVTKLDETDTPAGIAHAAFVTRLPLTIVTAGQRVPEDIHAAANEDIGAHLFPSSPRGLAGESRAEEEASGK